MVSTLIQSSGVISLGLPIGVPLLGLW
jgi:hypothetical protein